MKQPTLYIPHGGGPCFFMEWTYGPRDTWARMETFLRTLADRLPEKPKALLVVSAHWEEREPTVTSASAPSLYYDYYGFPPHTYALSWPAPGSPELATRVRTLLASAAIASGEDARRGFDHGVFVPLLLTFPDAGIPTVQLSLRAGLDAAEHLAIGRALAPLREEGVLLVGSGMSFHNMRASGANAVRASERFDAWLTDAVETRDAAARDAKLVAWARAPDAAFAHPRSEHLTPLFVAAGAAHGDVGARIYSDRVMGVAVSGHRFG